MSADEEVIEVSNDEDSRERPDEIEAEGEEEEAVADDEEEEIEDPLMQTECKSDGLQVNFLGNLGLITAIKFSELQNRRVERKRRSTADPQFDYSNWDIPSVNSFI